MQSWIQINGRKIGQGHPVYIIAEISANHNADFKQALKLVKAAKEAGADAVKLQTYTADTLTIDCENEYFRIKGGTLWDNRTLYGLYQEAYTPWEWQPKLKKKAEDLEIDLFSSPFDSTAVEFLERMNVPAYKVASCEIVDIALIEKIAQTGKPVIMSTGMATLDEIQDAITAAQKAGAKEIALMKCTSAYPAPPEEMNLNTIPALSKHFQLPVGLSDHTLGYFVAVAAVAVGASLIEKHFTLSRKVPGPDSVFSLEPEEFKAMVDTVRVTEKALGEVRYGPSGQEVKSRVFRRSLFVIADIKKGEKLTEQNIRSIRPGYGLSPKYLKEVMGLRANQDIVRGTPLQWLHVAKTSARNEDFR